MRFRSAVAGPIVAVAAVLALGLACAAGSASQAGGSAGLFTLRQAAAGAHEYAANCARCHGAHLEGAMGSPLRGASFTTLGTESGLSLGSFFHFVITETPVGAGGSLSHGQYVEILAFILHENGYRPGAQPLTFGAALGSRVRIAEQPPRAVPHDRDQ
ncbi:MAG: c-type cytochrome [Vulcanimicrobiaceae bacterium]